MAGICKVILIGNVTRDPELRFGKTDKPICHFGMAMDTKYGEKEETCFLDITAFGTLAEVASEYVTKGRQIYVEGRLQHQTWEKEGRKYSKHVVLADTIRFLGSKPAETSTAPTAAAAHAAHPEPEDGNDVPF